MSDLPAILSGKSVLGQNKTLLPLRIVIGRVRNRSSVLTERF